MVSLDPPAIAPAAAAAAIVAIVAVIALGAARRAGRTRKRLDLLAERGAAAFLATAYAAVSLSRTRAAFYRDSQYQSFSEEALPLDAKERPSTESTRYEDTLKVVATDAAGASFTVCAVPFSPEAAARLAGLVERWKARRAPGAPSRRGEG